MTFHSTACFNSVFNTVSTLFTVFGAFSRRWFFKYWISSLVIASSRLCPSLGIRCRGNSPTGCSRRPRAHSPTEPKGRPLTARNRHGADDTVCVSAVFFN